jgi:hypothetical protein
LFFLKFPTTIEVLFPFSAYIVEKTGKMDDLIGVGEILSKEPPTVLNPLVASSRVISKPPNQKKKKKPSDLEYVHLTVKKELHGKTNHHDFCLQ